jgi:multidrug transporter EmrE-like cation transporter
VKWFVLIAAIGLNAAANILIKTAVANKKLENIVGLIKDKSFLLPILAGIACFVCALVAFSYVLSRTNLSVAYPILTSGCFLTIGLTSWLFLGESITAVQILGFALIVAGIWLVAY